MVKATSVMAGLPMVNIKALVPFTQALYCAATCGVSIGSWSRFDQYTADVMINTWLVVSGE